LLSKLADFKASVLSTALFTLTSDWAAANGDPVGGRMALSSRFNMNVVRDFQDIIQLVYEYLSMPSVMHGRNIVFPCKQSGVIRVHGKQNDIVKRLNEAMYDMAMHTEEMRKCGFPRYALLVGCLSLQFLPLPTPNSSRSVRSGEASRLHQYHQYIQQRFEQLRIFKYYRTPQATRSFGRVYIFVLPWLVGPYFAWVFDDMDLLTYAYTIVLACFTFLILLGLLNATTKIEDPFVSDPHSWAPGIDVIKLDFEMAGALQAIEQYYANAELHRSWRMGHRLREDAQKKRDSIAAS